MQPNIDFFISLFAVWYAHRTAVPISLQSTQEELHYILSDAKCVGVITDTNADLFNFISNKLQIIYTKNEHLVASAYEKLPSPDTNALIIYTSGTTAQPKGAVHSHRSIFQQVSTLQKAWHWHVADKIINFLPLHHVHGLINICLSAICTGSHLELIEKFDAEKTFEIIEKKQINLLMAVPTIYAKLIEYYQNAPKHKQLKISQLLKKFRLFVSGSAALPDIIFEQWLEISEHTILERYGMTEIGMALSNPYIGTRKAGTVGFELPNVQTKIIDSQGNISHTGTLWVKSPALFAGYFDKIEQTKAVFDADGWFDTGDYVSKDAQGYFKILGRNSQDILKVGGYKISALEIEHVLLTSEWVSECAVIGTADLTYGQTIVAVVVLRKQANESTKNEIFLHLQSKLSAYKVPRKLFFVEKLPRNSMGKIQKKEIINILPND